jgi:probable phosphoglycerate mutase
MVKQMNGQYKVANPGLRPLWEEARRLARGLEGFQMTHTLRAGNAEADRLANDAMDRGMGKNRDQGTGIREQGTTPNVPAERAAAKPQRQVLEGYVKDGVVHLPDGIFVKVIRE